MDQNNNLYKKILITLFLFVATIGILSSQNSKKEEKAISNEKTQEEYYANIIQSISNPTLSNNNTSGRSTTDKITILIPTKTPQKIETKTPITTTPIATTSLSPSPITTNTPSHTTSTQNETTNKTPAPTTTNTPSQTQAPEETTQPENNNVPGEINIISLTSPVKQKEKATIEISLTKTSECSIKVTWPSGTISSSNDLAPKTTGNNNKISWTWSVNWNTKPGEAKINLTCSTENGHISKEATMEVIASQ